MAADDQFIRGAGMLAVLKVLEGGELYGYAIVEALAKTKGNALHLGQSTVYPMLYNLEAKGFVTARWDETGARPRSTARQLSSFRRFFRYLVREGVVKEDPTAQIAMPKYSAKVAPTTSRLRVN